MMRRNSSRFSIHNDMKNESTLAVPSLCVVMFLAILISLWVSAAEAFCPGYGGSRAFPPISKSIESSSPTRLWNVDVAAQAALERTKKRLEKMRKQQQQLQQQQKAANHRIDPRIESRYREYLKFPANALKQELKSKGMPTKGKKPDLARRLAEVEYLEDHPEAVFDDAGALESGARPTTYLDPKTTTSEEDTTTTFGATPDDDPVLERFCGMRLSETAGRALGRARFDTPTPIQRKALPGLVRGKSAVLHAETGSGKTLAYLLPITEALWKDALDPHYSEETDDLRYGLVLTPTRELAAQVAGVASALAPPGSVRLVSRPTNLRSEGGYWQEKQGNRVDDPEALAQEVEEHGRGSPPRLFVGSAKALLGSLYGDGRMPAPPTRKPAAKELLASTRWVVLDEVDRLLVRRSKKGLSTAQRAQRARKEQKGYEHEESGTVRVEDPTGPLHEKPAAILAAAVARRTLGRAQIVSASATVGRSLKRELSRVLGLPPREYPPVVRGEAWDASRVDEDGYDLEEEGDFETVDDATSTPGTHIDRAVTIPGSVKNYVLPVDASSTGKILTSAFFAIKNLNARKTPEKILLVLTKNCGITTTNAIGALKHFRCRPEPRSLLDALQDADGTDQLMAVHRKVAGSDGIGSDDDNDDGKGYLLVTGEDTVRGMHLAGLDTVVVVGRASGPDEYIHIAGRTGRAGRPGKVLNVVSEPHAVALRGWERMLRTEFAPVTMEDLRGLE